MKAMTKIALITTGILSMGALTACQSTQAPKEAKDGHHMMHGEHHKMSPEQREKMKQMRAQHKVIREQMQKACDGKAIGQTTQIQAGDKTIDGTCNMVFKPEHKAMGHMKHEFHHDGSRMKMKDMTEEQRAELKQKFEQKRAERKAQWDAVQQACAGQTDGKAIQVKLGEKMIDGKCVVKFQPQKPTATASAPTNAVTQPASANTATPAS